jgi:two-component system, chemotaxis family, chemotaxis protein CheY
MRILLVDDSQTMRSITRSVLATIGPHQVEEAGDGREALDKLATFAPELILCDWSMPVMDGLEFVQTVRRTDQVTPIIMVTTESELSRVMQAVRAGVNHYVVKPFTPNLLRKRIDETLRAASGPQSGRLAA